ncbi:hypothetical protein U1Q18_013665 [Sarracenia purpurea var. burkii]
MGKSPPRAATDKLQQKPERIKGQYINIRSPKITKPTLQNPKTTKPTLQNRSRSPERAEIGAELNLKQPKLRREMENNGSSCSSDGDRQNQRSPLSLVVSDCVERWFQDTLREAKAGEVSMQVLVGQMYYNGYGVPKDAEKVNFLSYTLRLD